MNLHIRDYNNKTWWAIRLGSGSLFFGMSVLHVDGMKFVQRCVILLLVTVLCGSQISPRYG